MREEALMWVNGTNNMRCAELFSTEGFGKPGWGYSVNYSVDVEQPTEDYAVVSERVSVQGHSVSYWAALRRVEDYLSMHLFDVPYSCVPHEVRMDCWA